MPSAGTYSLALLPIVALAFAGAPTVLLMGRPRVTPKSGVVAAE